MKIKEAISLMEPLVYIVAIPLFPLLMALYIIGIAIGLMSDSLMSGVRLFNGVNKRSIDRWVREEIP